MADYGYPDNDGHLDDDDYYASFDAHDNYGEFDDVYADADDFYVVFVDLMQVTLLILIDRLDLVRLHLVHHVRKTYQIQPSIVK